MLYLARAAGLLGTNVRHRYAALTRPGLRIYALSLQGTSFETRALGPLVTGSVPGGRLGSITVVLDGELIRRRGNERAHSARSLFIDSSSPWDERWEGRRFACVVWDWNESFGSVNGGPADARLSAVDTDRVARLFDTLMGDAARGPAGTALALEAGALARSFGVDLPPWREDLLAEAPPRGQALADLLNQSFSALDQKPMWIDLEGGAALSERHLRRRLTALGDWLVMPTGFRERLRLLRVHGAVRLLGAPGATMEHVARSVGYGSARALALALRAEGLGSHREIRALLRGDRPRGLPSMSESMQSLGLERTRGDG